MLNQTVRAEKTGVFVKGRKKKGVGGLFGKKIKEKIQVTARKPRNYVTLKFVVEKQRGPRPVASVQSGHRSHFSENESQADGELWLASDS